MAERYGYYRRPAVRRIEDWLVLAGGLAAGYAVLLVTKSSLILAALGLFAGMIAVRVASNWRLRASGAPLLPLAEVNKRVLADLARQPRWSVVLESAIVFTVATVALVAGAAETFQVDASIFFLVLLAPLMGAGLGWRRAVQVANLTGAQPAQPPKGSLLWRLRWVYLGALIAGIGNAAAAYWLKPTPFTQNCVLVLLVAIFVAGPLFFVRDVGLGRTASLKSTIGFSILLWGIPWSLMVTPLEMTSEIPEMWFRLVLFVMGVVAILAVGILFGLTIWTIGRVVSALSPKTPRG